MPTYEYACKKCGEHVEVVQSFSDDPLTTCPNCGAKQLRKVFGTVGIVFKGNGFYKTDSRGKSEAKVESKSESKAEAKTESKSEAKSSDAKSDTKADTKKSEKKSTAAAS